MNLFKSTCAAFALCLVATAAPAVAASHFTDCAFNTGSNATLVVPHTAAVEALGAKLVPGDELAVYTAAGVCAGSGVWTDTTLVFAVWGDDVTTPETDGLLPGETLEFRAWIAASGTEVAATLAVEFSSARAHHNASGRYSDNAIFVVERLVLTQAASDDELGRAVSSEQYLPGDVPLTLDQNYPNPFNPSTTISYRLNAATNVRLSVLNVLGQTVRVLADGYQAAGDYQVQLHMDDMPSGMYLYRVETAEMTLVRTMLLSK